METYTMSNADYVAAYQGSSIHPMEATTGKRLYDPYGVRNEEGALTHYVADVVNEDPENTADQFISLPVDGTITFVDERPVI